MNDERLERELRATLLRDDPGPMRDELQMRIASVPTEMPVGRGFKLGRGLTRSPLASRLLASVAGVAALAVVGSTLVLLVALHLTTSGPATSGQPSVISPGASPTPSPMPTPLSSSAALVPWLNATPTPEPSPTAAIIPPGTRPCTTADLKTSVDVSSGAMAGAITGVVRATNISAASCTLDGPPSNIEIRGAGPLSIQFRAVNAHAPGTESFTAPGPVLLASGTQAHAWLFWDNWCGATGYTVAMHVTLPDGGGVLNLAIGDVYPRCNAQNAGSSLSAWRFALPQPPPPNQTVVSGHVTIVAPSTATPGELLTFTVTLTNLGSTAAPLDPCPTYSETLVVNGAALKPPAYQTYVLNCAALGPSIAPGASVLLQMRYAIPSDVAPGPLELLWGMDPGGPFDGNSVVTRAPLMIMPGP